jgi:hypothetical protein
MRRTTDNGQRIQSVPDRPTIGGNQVFKGPARQTHISEFLISYRNKTGRKFLVTLSLDSSVNHHHYNGDKGKEREEV